MKKLSYLIVTLVLLLCLCLLSACDSSPAVDTTAEESTAVPGDPITETPTETPTEAPTEAPTEEATEEITEPPVLWEVDTGIFNEGNVTYTKADDGSITATPAEGYSLGLDVTDKTDLVSICYSIWFDYVLRKSDTGVDYCHDISQILAGNRDWGGSPSFHYWSKPALGYYCSSNREVIHTHMTQLYTAGVDFIIIDLTNAGDNYLGSSAWTDYIEKPMDAIFETIMEMRVEGLGTPYVVFWVGTNDGPLYQALYDRYHAPEKWKDCFVYWDGKPFLLTTHTYPKDFPLPELFTVRSMWGLSVSYAQGQWSFLSTNNHNRVTRGPDKSAEQVSVAVASQADYMSNFNTAKGRDGGMFWYAQWQTAFDRHPKVVTLTWWNEWTAQRLRDPNGNYVFTDNYNAAYSRDIEPMEGGHGDQYYQWMIRYISAYKGGLECPVLIEEEYEDQLEAFMEAYRKGRN